MKTALTALLALCFWGCPWGNPSDSRPYAPARLPVGPLTLGVWLPAGLERFSWDAASERRLADLGINQLEWLQRATVDGRTAEQIAMDFCDRQGLWMPVYYEPRGFSPYDKLHNWAARKQVDGDFSAQVERRVAELKRQWQPSPGFGGYLVGHEDYAADGYPALGLTVEALRRVDGTRPAISVGAIGSYAAPERFLDAFFVEGSPANIFQHEHYVFHAQVPPQGRRLQGALDDLVGSYDAVARRLAGRNGRWHAIVQVHAEHRDGLGHSGPFYRKPSAAEIRLQAGLALTRGASGIVYFLYSSGLETVRNSQGEVVQERRYEGLIDAAGAPASGYESVQQLNAELSRIGAVLEPLYFYGAFAGERPGGNPLLHRAEEATEFGVFGDSTGPGYLLAVNRRSLEQRQVRLRPKDGLRLYDALTGAALGAVGEAARVDLEPGGLRLLQARPVAAAGP